MVNGVAHVGVFPAEDLKGILPQGNRVRMTPPRQLRTRKTKRSTIDLALVPIFSEQFERLLTRVLIVARLLRSH